jgi:membrane protease YdiL (CAAX protease family)
MKRDDAIFAGGVVGAFGLFAATFRGPRTRFWQRMTVTGLSLGTLSLVANPDVRTALRPRLRDVAYGLGAAAALYGVFQFGDRMARRIMPTGAADIGNVYELRQLRPNAEIAARLAFVIGPAEELFWRGFVQHHLRQRTGRWRGAALASLTYGGAHIVTGNLTLIGAATAAGAFWSALEAVGMSMPALIVSHVAWDIWIFLIAPTEPPAQGERGQAFARPRTFAS